jgi:DNA mismatch endonuclease (patch repair protein)
MRATRQTGTAAEQLIRAALDDLGLTYDVDRGPVDTVRSRADVVFPIARVAVFVDGCFWHSCPIHATFPKSNAEWWEAKLESNRRRDAATNERLAAAGWLVLRFWEHEAPGEVARVVAEQVARLAP